jgi:hypothetical protein
MTPEIQSTLLSLFIQYLLPILFSALATLSAWALAQLAKKLGAQAAHSKAAAIAARLTHLAETIVADLEATLKPELAKATADGKLDKAEILRLRDVALQRLKALAGERGLLELQGILGIAAPQVDGYLQGILERAVDQLPSKPAPVPS